MNGKIGKTIHSPRTNFPEIVHISALAFSPLLTFPINKHHNYHR